MPPQQLCRRHIPNRAAINMLLLLRRIPGENNFSWTKQSLNIDLTKLVGSICRNLPRNLVKYAKSGSYFSIMQCHSHKVRCLEQGTSNPSNLWLLYFLWLYLFFRIHSSSFTDTPETTTQQDRATYGNSKFGDNAKAIFGNVTVSYREYGSNILFRLKTILNVVGVILFFVLLLLSYLYFSRYV